MEGYNLERDKNQKDYDLNNRKMDLDVAENDKQRQQEILMANLNSKLSMDEQKFLAELEQKAKAYDAQLAGGGGNTGSGSGNVSSGNGTKSNSGSDSTKAPLTEKQVESWADALNDTISNDYGKDYKALEKVGGNEYKPADAGADYIILKVLNSTDLTQEQKDYLLYNKFHITEDQVNNVIRDHHYR